MTSDEVVDEGGSQPDHEIDIDPVPGQEAEPGESPIRRYALLGAAGLAAAALIVAAVFGVQWWVDSGNGDLALAQARDQVVSTGRTAVKAYTELDYTDPDAYFQRQLAVSDPDMQTQIKNTENNYRQAMADAKTKVVTTVQDIGVEELNDHEGKASFLAAISTQVTKEGQQPVAKPLRLEVQMTRTGQDWKVSSISSVPTVSSGQ